MSLHKTKVGGVFVAKPVKVKLSGSFVQKTHKSFPLTGPPPALGAPWRWDASAATVLVADPLTGRSSAQYISTWLGYAIQNDVLSTPFRGHNEGYGVPTVVANTTDSAIAPSYAVPGPGGGQTQFLGTPPGSRICRIPLGARPNTGGDHHLSILDTTVYPYRCTELYQAVMSSTTGRITNCGSGCTFPVSVDGGGNLVWPWTAGANGLGRSWTSNAANMPMRAGAITPDEILNDLIPHCLHFANHHIGASDSAPGSDPGDAIWPATQNVPTGSCSSANIREGHWLRLAPSYNVATSGFPTYVKTILTCLKQYGMFLRDNCGSQAGPTIYTAEEPGTVAQGGNWDLPGQPGTSTDWATVLAAKGAVGSAQLGGDFPSGMPWSQMQVLEPPGP